ncbi:MULTISPECIES: PhzF family phenazine biosynthesis protein [Actinosynnema]|uniref:PhzF family phenazine biosynthesis protein n=1 Tax=Actinosynnema TaxID=40566 RepID=UPI0020A44E8D|nr:PhzF family phenazine biosynthesis protein [Actinosynnema pretiosum]MCP2098481.1 phenazine biosynthesis protein PhzF family [Actinosynnema pretiosum]
MSRWFSQVDVFAGTSLRGNPVAVVGDADDLPDAALARFARWTNLSETVFLLPPTGPADYRVRIFTPSGELPFAGHPTLGACHAWAERSGVDKAVFTQECEAGLVRVRRTEGGLAFAAPPLTRSGPVDADLRAHLAEVLDVPVVDAAHVDNGPGWLAVLAPDAGSVLGARVPTARELADAPALGLVGPHPPGSPHLVEVRALFVEGDRVTEDPVTGSLNAGVARWLVDTGRAPDRYAAHQGTVVGADGHVLVERDADDDLWIGGATTTVVTGRVTLD